MHIIVYGIGSVGGFYSCLLAKALENNKEHKLSLIARPRVINALNTNKAIKYRKETNGEVSSIEKFPTDIFNYVEKYSELEINPEEEKVVLLCVKSKDTVSACEDIKTKFDENTTVLSVQNGVSNEAKVESILGKGSVLGCLTNVAAETVEAGVYLQIYNPVNLYRLQFGEIHTEIGMERVNRIGEVLDSCNITAKRSENIVQDQWAKLVWNSAFNPISALYKATLGKLAKNPQATREALGIMAETTAVARAKGINSSEQTPEKHWELTNRPEWASFKTSMLQDLEAGKELETDELLGYVISEAEKLNIETPFAKKVFDELAVNMV